MKQIERLLYGLLAIMAVACPSQAPAMTFPSYTAAVLNGCYSFVLRTTDVPNATYPVPPTFLLGNGKSHIGVMCFNGVGGPASVKVVVLNDNNGTAGISSATGSYAITPAIGGGMGVMNFGGLARFAFAVNNVVAGVAQGFQFMKYLSAPTALILGGTAYFQQPNAPANYTPSVLVGSNPEGCYSFFGESVMASNFPVSRGKDLLGTLCFDGVSTLIRGYWRDNNGLVGWSSSTSTAGYSYVFTTINSPTWGMGTITFPGGEKWAIAAFNVTGCPAACLAGGFQLMQITAPTPAVRIFTGTAFYQGP